MKANFLIILLALLKNFLITFEKQKYFISSTIPDCYPSNCNGKRKKPFYPLIHGLKQIIYATNEKKDPNLFIFLYGDNFIIKDKDFLDSYPKEEIAQVLIISLKLEFNISIMPAICKNNFENCKNGTSPFVKIDIRSTYFSFIISRKLIWYNIVFTGNDINLNVKLLKNPNCVSDFSGCCDIYDILNEKNSEDKRKCYLKNIKNAFPFSSNINKKHGIFEFGNTLFGNEQSLEFYNCKFYYINSISKYKSLYFNYFIGLPNSSKKFFINFFNSHFESVIFKQGIISTNATNNSQLFNCFLNFDNVKILNYNDIIDDYISFIALSIKNYNIKNSFINFNNKTSGFINLENSEFLLENTFIFFSAYGIKAISKSKITVINSKIHLVSYNNQNYSIYLRNDNFLLVKNSIISGKNLCFLSTKTTAKTNSKKIIFINISIVKNSKIQLIELYNIIQLIIINSNFEAYDIYSKFFIDIENNNNYGTFVFSFNVIKFSKFRLIKIDKILSLIENNIFSEINLKLDYNHFIYLNKGRIIAIRNIFNSFIINFIIEIRKESIFISRNNIFNLINGVSIKETNSGNISIHSTNFTNSYNFGQSASILFSESVKSFIYNCLFKNLTSGRGNIYFGKRCIINIFNSSFLFLLGKRFAGGIQVYRFNKILFFNCIFNKLIEENSIFEGGLIFSETNNYVTFINNNFSNIKSYSKHGLFYINRNCFYLFISNQIQSVNSNYEACFAFVNYKCSIIIKDCIFSNLNLLKHKKGAGIVLFSLNYLIFHNCSINHVFSQGGGGFFDFINDNSIIITNSNLNNIHDKSKIGGGVFHISFYNKILIEKLMIFNTTTSGQGGIFFIANYNFIKINGIIANKSRDKSFKGGGSLFAQSTNIILIINSSFIDSISQESGGTIHIFEKNVFYCYNCFFYNCKDFSIFKGGGVIYSFIYNVIQILNSFTNNSKTNKNGGVFSVVFFNKVFVYNSKFYYSEAKEKGGFLELSKNNKAYFNNSYFIENIAFINGNLFSFEQDNKVEIFNCNYFLKEKKIILAVGILFTSQIGNYIKINGFLFKELVIQLIFSVLGSYLNAINIKVINLVNVKFKILHAVNSNITFKGFNIIYSTPYYFNIIYFEKCNVSFKNGIISIKKNNKDFLIKNQQKLNLQQSFFKFINKCLISFNFLNFYGQEMINSLTYFFEIYQSDLIIIKSSFIGNEISRKNHCSLIFSSCNEKISNKEEKIHYLILKQSIFIKGICGKSFISSINIDNIFLYQNSFYNNIGYNGSILNIKNPNYLKIIRNLFKKNSANNFVENSFGKGGIFFIIGNSKKSLNSKFLIKVNIFIGNRAKIGGIIYLENFPLHISNIIKNNLLLNNNSFFNNFAYFYGNLIASNIENFYITNNINSQKLSKNLTINNLVSKIDNIFCFGFIIPFDIFKQKAINTFENYQNYINSQTRSIIIFKKQIYHNFVCLTNLIKRKKLVSLLMVDLKAYNYYKTSSNSFSIKLKFLNKCEIGEIFNNEAICIPCQENTFSFERKFFHTSMKCNLCLNENFYCFGKFNLTPKTQYWRKSVYSSLFLLCPNDIACLGDNRKIRTTYDSNFAIGICKKGYKGILCTECDKEYGVSENYKCYSCKQSWYYIRLVLSGLLKIITIAYFVHQSLKMSEVFLNEKKELVLSPVALVFLFKILTNHLQYLIILLSFPYGNKQIIGEILSMIFKLLPDPSDGLSIDCLFKNWNIILGIHYYRLCVVGIMPVLIVLICYIYLKFYLKRKKKKVNPTNIDHKDSLIKKLNFSSMVWNLSIVLFFIMYVDIMRVCLHTFLCKNINDSYLKPDYRLVKDYSSICWGKDHIKWIFTTVIPIIVTIGVIFPVSLVIGLAKFHSKNMLEDEKILSNYGFFYYGFKKKFFYWEVVVFQGRKLILIVLNIIFTNFVNLNFTYKILCYLLFIEINLFFNLWLEPYEIKYKFLQNIENISFICLLSNFFVILFSLPSNENNLNFNYKGFISVLAFLFNFFFLISWGKLFYKFEIKKWKFFNKAVEKTFEIARKISIGRKKLPRIAAVDNEIKVKSNFNRRKSKNEYDRRKSHKNFYDSIHVDVGSERFFVKKLKKI